MSYYNDGNGNSNRDAGKTIATAIDLTGDDDPPTLLSPLLSLQLSRRPLPRRPLPRLPLSRLPLSRHPLPRLPLPRRRFVPEIKELTSHRDLKFWKRKDFNELDLENELQLALSTEPKFIQTIVPNKYLRKTFKQMKKHRRRPVFPGKVEILGAVAAVRKAYEEHTHLRRDPETLVIWTDGSGTAGGGTGIAYRQTKANGDGWEPWVAIGLKIAGRRVSSDQLETLAIMKAIEVACEKARENPARCKKTVIYTDSTSSLQFLDTRPDMPLAQNIIAKAMTLRRLGSEITACWCPGHSDVPGNELADKMARRAAGYTFQPGEECIALSDDEEEGDKEEEEEEDDEDEDDWF